MNELLYVDGKGKSCDFCENKEKCAVLNWMDKCIIRICRDCLERFSKEIKK